MPGHRFDASLKELVEGYPRDWVLGLGLPETGPVQVVDADIAAVGGAADKVVRVGGPRPWLLHVEFQASYDPLLPLRMLRYNVLLRHRHELPVHTAAVLLRPAADGPAMTDPWSAPIGPGSTRITFGYECLRVWQRPAEEFLNAGLGLSPLAVVCAEDEAGLRSALHAIADRATAATDRRRAGALTTIAVILAGLRHPQRRLLELMEEYAMNLEESATYQLILERGIRKGEALAARKSEELGALSGARRMLLLAGESRFGAIDARRRARLDKIASKARLERMMSALFAAADWDAVFAVR